MKIITNGGVGQAIGLPQVTLYDAMVGMRLDVRSDTNMVILEREDGAQIELTGVGGEDVFLAFAKAIDDQFMEGTEWLDLRTIIDPAKFRMNEKKVVELAGV